MSHLRAAPERTTQRPRRTWLWCVGVATLASASFIFGLSAQPHFADESAYVSQAYFLDLLFQRDDPRWLEYPAYDLPPLPKYLIGISLRLGGHPLPSHDAMMKWYEDTRYRTVTPGSLWYARLPSVILGGVGCAAIFVLGETMAGRRAGLLAAFLLAINPLYRMHARRAMSDVPAEAMILLTAAIGLLAWRAALAGKLRPGGWIKATVGAGVCAGLAVLAKLNGGLGLMILASWVALALLLPRYSRRGKLAFAALAVGAAATSYVTFAALNPYITTRPRGRLPHPFARRAQQGPWARTMYLIEHRVEVSRMGQTRLFPEDALISLRDKLKAVAVQGFGRFGLLGPPAADSTRRYDWLQDWGALHWAPWVIAGAIWAARRGVSQFVAREPPTAWAILVQAAVASITVTAFIPLAWDRYYLSLQPGWILLASGLAAAAFQGVPPPRAQSEA
jgi:4-amino-4-deoxy-L-arabinose transferase-like glycosyltransferase